MERERWNELLEHPAEVAKGDLEDLRSMTERFPWFSAAHLLLAVGTQATDDVVSGDPTITPAAHLPSRAVLFDLTRNETAVPPARMHVVKEGPEPPPSMQAIPELPAVEPTVAFAPLAPPLEALPDPMLEGLGPVPGRHMPTEESYPPEPRPAMDVATTAHPQEEQPAPTGPDLLDVQIAEAVRIGSYDITRDPPPPASSIAEHASPDASQPPHASPAVTAMSDPGPEERSVAPPAPVLGPSPAPLPDGHPVGKLRFTDWLSTSTADSVPAPPPPVHAPPAPAKPSSPEMPEAEVPQADAGSIIDRFIHRTEPATPQEKTPFFTPQQAAKRSLQDDGLVSETLAKVYAQQGDIAKAIDTYARLAVLHPGKSVYFAALSKALEGRSNK